MRPLPFVFGLGATALLAGCLEPGSRVPALPAAAQTLASERRLSEALPLPTKDEVALVDGRPLSLSGFLTLRGLLKNRSTTAVLWVGTAVLVLQNASRGRGEELDASVAVEIARYALGELGAAETDSSLKRFFVRPGLPPTPTEVRSEIDRLLAAAIVRRNEFALASLNQL